MVNSIFYRNYGYSNVNRIFYRNNGYSNVNRICFTEIMVIVMVNRICFTEIMVNGFCLTKIMVWDTGILSYPGAHLIHIWVDGW